MWTQLIVIGYYLVLNYFISVIYGYMVGPHFFNGMLHSCHQKILCVRTKSQCSRRKKYLDTPTWAKFSLVWFSLWFDVGLVQNHERWSTLIQRIPFRLSSQVNVDTVFPPRWSTLMVLNNAQSNTRLNQTKENLALVHCLLAVLPSMGYKEHLSRRTCWILHLGPTAVITRSNQSWLCQTCFSKISLKKVLILKSII